MLRSLETEPFGQRPSPALPVPGAPCTPWFASLCEVGVGWLPTQVQRVLGRGLVCPWGETRTRVRRRPVMGEKVATASEYPCISWIQ